MREEEYTSKSLKTVTSEYKFPIIDICALLWAFPRGMRGGLSVGMKGINLIKKHIEEGVRCYITGGVEDECLDDAYWIQLVNRRLNEEEKYKLSGLIQVFSDRGLVLNLNPKDDFLYNEMSPYLHESVNYPKLSPEDADIFLSALFSSKKRGDSSLVISNDSKIKNLWREFKEKNKINPRRFGFALRRGLDAYELLH